MDEMVPLLVFDNGMSFGELALLRNKPRAGTVLTLTDCYFAVINADDFDILLKKDKALKIATSVAFMRQVPYINNWLVKDTNNLLMLCSERKVELRGQTIFREGDPANKVIIILQGEVEIVKTNLRTIFYNQTTGMLGMNECNEKAKLLKSEVILNPKFVPQPPKALINYMGSEFQLTI